MEKAFGTKHAMTYRVPVHISSVWLFGTINKIYAFTRDKPFTDQIPKCCTLC